MNFVTSPIVLPRYMPRSGIAGSYDIPIFSFLETPYRFPCWLYQLNLHQYCRRVLFFLNYLFIFGGAGSSLLLFSLWCVGFLWWLLLWWNIGSRAQGLSSSSSWALEHRLSHCDTFSGFFTTEPPEKPQSSCFKKPFISIIFFLKIEINAKKLKYFLLR